MGGTGWEAAWARGMGVEAPPSLLSGVVCGVFLSFGNDNWAAHLSTNWNK